MQTSGGAFPVHAVARPTIKPVITGPANQHIRANTGSAQINKWGHHFMVNRTGIRYPAGSALRTLFTPWF